ncbi:metallophosphoesterase family protein [Phytoactinopolyspora endophytica]|uniref:metallophosphoesterase family protein n=1 Tax=Phytoactinopolyspora endophytica TaxID=1642495 RepID=UPI0013ED61BA|nr:DNA repair exonuclease [Phytoactinopolyspora endophytica]
MTVVVHAADLHINSPLRRLARHYPGEDWHAPTRDALAHLVTATTDVAADVLVLAGDIADREWYDDDVARLFSEALGLLDDAGVTVVVIDGNHDVACGIRQDVTEPVRRLPPNVVWCDDDAAHTTVLESAGLAVHGRGLPAATVAEDLTRTFPARTPGLVNMGVQHTSLDNRRGGRPCAPTTVEALLDLEYDYWALGHAHTRQVVHSAPWIVFPGNTQGRKATEPGPKGATVVTADPHGVTGVQHLELSSVRWECLTVRCSGHDAPDDVIERTHTELNAAARRLRPGQRLAARIELTEACRSERRAAAVEAGIRSLAGSDPRYLVEEVRTPGASGPRTRP